MIGGCTAQCGATAEKLAKLQPGMSYEETRSIMGCPGRLVMQLRPASADYATVEWNGPDTILMRTRIDFIDGKLRFYTTDPSSAL